MINNRFLILNHKCPTGSSEPKPGIASHYIIKKLRLIFTIIIEALNGPEGQFPDGLNTFYISNTLCHYCEGEPHKTHGKLKKAHYFN